MSDDKLPERTPDYQQASGLQKVLTPGGHIQNDDLIVAGSSHRKIGNPLPSGMMAFSSTLLLLSLYTLKVANIQILNAILTMSLAFGGFGLFLSGLWEFASGNTFGATMFVAYSAFWWGFSMIHIPFFGMTGTYDGAPGIYSATGLGAAEAANALGAFYWVWFGITTCLLLSSFRSSGALVLFLFVLDLTFAMHGAYQYTQNSAIESAAGGLGTAASFIGYYIGSALFFTKNTSLFSLPVLHLHQKE